MIALVFTILCASAHSIDNYIPFLKDGKQWVVYHTFLGVPEYPMGYDYQLDYIVEGDSIGEYGEIKGKSVTGRIGLNQWYEVHTKTLQKEDMSTKQLMVFGDYDQAFHTYFDFSISETDPYHNNCMVESDSILVRGVKYHRMKISHYVGPLGYARKTVLVEGIGSREDSYVVDSTFNPTYVPTDGGYCYIYKVIDNGVVIFEYADFDAPSIAGTESVVYDATKAKTAGWYDLRGMRLTAKPATAGVYIVRLTDGSSRKIIIR